LFQVKQRLFSDGQKKRERLECAGFVFDARVVPRHLRQKTAANVTVVQEGLKDESFSLTIDCSRPARRVWIPATGLPTRRKRNWAKLASRCFPVPCSPADGCASR